jgi:hypothetical protein
VNFVGHAVVAWRERAEPAFAFGAMVPDLRRFADRAVPAPTRDLGALVAGVDSHHRVDAAFHDHELFRAWTAAVLAAMPSPDRGARAAAHVAVELAIDGLLLARDGAGAYAVSLDWAAASFDGPWLATVVRMRTGEIVEAYGSAEGIAARVVGVMDRRPRLRRLAVDEAALVAAVAGVTPTIESSLDRLLRDLGLSRAP